jgi:hypothetical protein
LTDPIPTCEFALYSLNALALPADNGHPPFSAARYSKYKYGSVAAAETFAQALGVALAERCPDLAGTPRLLMTSSPYAYVPTAATSLARKLQPVLDPERARHGLPPVPFVQVDRISTSAGDYGMLSARARDRCMAANVVSFRRFRPDQLRNAHLLVVDDLRVTGAHQRCLMRATDTLPLSARTFLYIAAFPGCAGRSFDPAQEDALNHAAIKTLDDLAALVADGEFAWNVRVCKFILNPANRDSLSRFLGRMPTRFVRALYRNSREDGYACMATYAASHAIVHEELGRRCSLT